MQYFAKIALAAVVELYEIVNEHDQSADFAVRPMDIDPRAAMSLLDLARKFKSAKRGRAAGPDLLPDDLHKVAPWELAEI